MIEKFKKENQSIKDKYLLLKNISLFINKNFYYNDNWENNNNYVEKYNKKTGIHLNNPLSFMTDSKSGLCGAFAELFIDIAKEFNIESYYVGGFLKKDDGPHAWVVVKLNDKYYFIDPTWNQNDNNLEFFLLGEHSFSKTHDLSPNNIIITNNQNNLLNEIDKEIILRKVSIENYR